MGLCASLRALCCCCCSKPTTQEITSQDSPHPPTTQEPPGPKPDPPELAPSSSSSSSEIGPILRRPYDDITQIYDLGKELGRGPFGITYLRTEKSTGLKYACKSISRRKLLTDKEIEDVRREIAIFEHLRGQPNIVQFKEAYEDRSNLHLVMELCSGGELFDRITKQGSYSEKEAARIGRQMVNVVHVCHSLGVMHRDLKPENLLLVSREEDAPLKATDFGLSVFIEEGKVYKDIVGSAYYVAPELLKRNYGKEIDVWSAGVILYILLSGVPPFWAETEKGIIDAILKGHIDFESSPWPSISTGAKDIIRKMLTMDPKKRITAAQAIEGCRDAVYSNGEDDLLLANFEFGLINLIRIIFCEPEDPWLKEGGDASDKPLDSAKGEGEKPSPSPSRKRAKTEEESKQEFPAAAGAKSVYLFACHLYGPNAHVLYVIDTSPLPDPSALPADDSPMEITPPEPVEQPLDPFVEFPRAKFPMEMCAVEFDSKLYILGGKFDEPSLGGPDRFPDDDFCPFPSDVHIFDPTCSSLKVGPKMNSGKFKPSAFVVDSMIYVVSGCLAGPDDDSLVRFEVLKPDDDGTGGTWTRLEDPPFKRTLFTGHLVVNRQVFFSTLNGEFFCFDLDSSKWWRKPGEKMAPLAGPNYCQKKKIPSAMNPGKVVFVLLSKAVPSLRRTAPCTHVMRTLVSPLLIHRELARATVSLAHIGERLFCHVLFGNPLKTTTPQNWYAQDPTRCYANITMFEASKDTYYSEDKGCNFFRGKLLQSALFVITTEGCTFLSDAFTLPS
ncbi:hypothetical protein RHSIM_Rhsim06G0014500 [Rhododendron simsii]|uniref:non-specific serine/threonine protein kinase n=1 Tax=Rhododendron simsii TaxID=118357 RepID=A0A834GYG4_RHOSS|nr:hypothetical protein RHSIM_Rhsim06G0014500 [Rhododendron simsii]